MTKSITVAIGALGVVKSELLDRQHELYERSEENLYRMKKFLKEGVTISVLVDDIDNLIRSLTKYEEA